MGIDWEGILGRCSNLQDAYDDLVAEASEEQFQKELREKELAEQEEQLRRRAQAAAEQDASVPPVEESDQTVESSGTVPPFAYYPRVTDRDDDDNTLPF